MPVLQSGGGLSLSGEHHVPGYNYLGPGTRYLERQRIGGDWAKPINNLDALAKDHDGAYVKAGVEYDIDKNKPAFMEKVKRADKIFIDKSKREGVLGTLASKAIGLKATMETAGILDSKTFSGRGKGTTKATDPAKRLRKIIIDSSKSQTGGFLPILAGALLAPLTEFALSKLYNHFFPQAGGGIASPLNKEALIEKLSTVDPKKLKVVIRKL
jgi:hypothetical protein